MAPCCKGCTNVGASLSQNGFACDLCEKRVHAACTWEIKTIENGEELELDVCGDCYAKNSNDSPYSMGQPSQDEEEEEEAYKTSFM